MAWKKIADKGDVPEGGGKAFKIDGKQIAIFNQDGYHAMDDLCVHQDGSCLLYTSPSPRDRG